MSSTPFTVLVGLDPTSPEVPDEARREVQKQLAEVGAQFEAVGLQFQFVSVDPNDLKPLMDALTAHDKVDAVVIGFGVRRNPDLTYLLEQLVDTVRTAAPQAKILFNTMPNTTLGAVKRWFPVSC